MNNIGKVVNQFGKVDITGLRFGRLVVIKEMPGRVNNWQINWLCKCDCGKEKVITGNRLKNGHTKSCGCFAAESTKIRNATHGQNRRSGATSEYNTWNGIKYRCYNPEYKEYHLYGGRGIKMCDQWLNSFENFFTDMGAKPSPKHSIDRYPDVNGNYEPSNCRWATSKEQARFKRNNVWIEYNGVKMVAKDWANYFGITQSSLNSSTKRRGSFAATFEYFTKRKDKYDRRSTKKPMFSPSQTEKIKELRKTGISVNELMKSFNCSKTSIHRAMGSGFMKIK